MTTPPRLLDFQNDPERRLAVRVFHDERLSFHPKAYLFHSGSVAEGFVGSSNLSRSGVAEGVEWNVGVDRVAELVRGFDALWADERAVPLSLEWLRGYRLRALAGRPPVPPPEPPSQPVSPRPVQELALRALEETRHDGHEAGLVVMATGLGKTWLAAFDASRPQFRRVLFVAHRDEILRQSRDVFRAVMPGASLGLFSGLAKHPDADVLFASIQTLSGRLEEFPPGSFDYVVVDEFHHAAGRTYRRVINHFQPAFLLGLTATPDRMDGADLLALCGDNLVYECSLVEGIGRRDLSPFSYFGVPDPVDYQPIRWRYGRFDPPELEHVLESDERAERVWMEWNSRGRRRALGFCVSVAHAQFMSRYFSARGARAVAVHSGPGSAARHQSVEDLSRGEVDVLFTVDIFNEGLDVPEVEAVLMLRPTDSPVVFLQQLGRGLRKAEGKDELLVVDLIGNHRSFLSKPRALLALSADRMPSTAEVMKAMRTREFHLPFGCSVEFDLAAIDLLTKLPRLVSAGSALEDYCRGYVEAEGSRPSAMQAYRSGFNPAAVRNTYGGWFGFLAHLGLLAEDEAEVERRHREVLLGFEAEQITKSYKLVTLAALLHDGALRAGAGVSRIAWTAHRVVSADPRLIADAKSEEMPDPAAVDEDTWRSYWRGWPIAAWAGELRGRPGRWFRLDGDRLVPTFGIEEELGEAFDAMVSELVEYRLARYLLTKEMRSAGAMVCRVAQAGGRPMVFLDRAKYPELPQGTARFLADGEEYEGDFVKVALNVARRTGGGRNALPDLLHRWFGSTAGQPGTNHQIALERDRGELVATPVMPDTPSTARVDDLA